MFELVLIWLPLSTKFQFFKQFCKDMQVLKVCHKIMGFKSFKHFIWRPENVDMPDDHKE